MLSLTASFALLATLLAPAARKNENVALGLFEMARASADAATIASLLASLLVNRAGLPAADLFSKKPPANAQSPIVSRSASGES